MRLTKTKGDIVFHIINILVLSILALSCLLPFIHILALSFSSSAVVTQGRVGLWPVEFTLSSYEYVFQKPEFIRAFLNSVLRVLAGTALDMFLLIITAYPLSKTKKQLPGRTVFAFFFVVTMFVAGGMIPSYLIVSGLKLKDTIWALILPGTVQAFNITILLNFFRQIPTELEEASIIDGASQVKILLRIYLPLSLPALATLMVFITNGHWNAWFDGLIYMSSPDKYPLQTYLHGVLIEPNFTLMDTTQTELMAQISSKTFQSAQIMIATIPILLVYPFMQRFFVKGMTLGSLKG